MKKIAALILLAALTACAGPQPTYFMAGEHRIGQAEIQAERTDVYYQFMRMWEAIGRLFSFSW